VRTSHEALLVVHRPAYRSAAPEFLVLLRAPAGQGYWHLVSGGVESGEEPREAALRELEEETGLARPPGFEPLSLELGYRQPTGGAWITVHPFAVAAAAGWEPVLNEEHVEYRWCSEDAAVELLEYPEPRKALHHVAQKLRAGP
jgi:8-oxo-dGTP pyrophosphatase MutT (NUDIX family)